MASLDLIDRTASRKIHEATVKPKFFELIVFPFAFAFSPLFIPFIIFLTGFILPRQNIIAYNGKVPDFDDDYEYIPSNRRNNPYFYVIQYTT